MAGWLIRLVARVPASVYAKLLAAFLAIVVLLITVGAAGLRALGIIPGRPRLWNRERGTLGFAQPPRW